MESLFLKSILSVKMYDKYHAITYHLNYTTQYIFIVVSIRTNKYHHERLKIHKLRELATH